MNDLMYVIAVLLSLAAYAVAGFILWQAVEATYYIFCKITGRDY